MRAAGLQGALRAALHCALPIRCFIICILSDQHLYGGWITYTVTETATARVCGPLVVWESAVHEGTAVTRSQYACTYRTAERCRRTLAISTYSRFFSARRHQVSPLVVGVHFTAA